jgi:hypothetical protein
MSKWCYELCVKLDLSWQPLTMFVVLLIPGVGVLDIMAASM